LVRPKLFFDFNGYETIIHDNLSRMWDFYAGNTSIPLFVLDVIGDDFEDQDSLGVLSTVCKEKAVLVLSQPGLMDRLSPRLDRLLSPKCLHHLMGISDKMTIRTFPIQSFPHQATRATLEKPCPGCLDHTIQLHLVTQFRPESAEDL